MQHDADDYEMLEKGRDGRWGMRQWYNATSIWPGGEKLDGRETIHPDGGIGSSHVGMDRGKDTKRKLLHG